MKFKIEDIINKVKHAIKHSVKRSPLWPMVKHFKDRFNPLYPAFSIGRTKSWDAAARWLFSEKGRGVLHDKGFLSSLKDDINRVINVELLLVAARKHILLEEKDLLQRRSLQNFVYAVVQQCINNEYIFYVSDEEKKTLAKLNFKMSEFKKNATKALNKFIVVIMYTPIPQLFSKPEDYVNYLKFMPESIKKIVDGTMSAYIEERKIAESIKILNPIKDKISLKVAIQYKKFPYPRWVNITLPQEGSRKKILRQFFNEHELKFMDGSFDVLNAGCGTGRKTLQIAKAYGSNASVLANDLSFVSLSYAIRMTRRFKINNIDFIQADIFDLPLLGKQFEVIECTGVLHHLGNPIKGWKLLVDCLKPGGIMHISLYSELARRKIVQLRKDAGFHPNFIDDEKLVNSEFIRHYRYELMLNSPEILDEEFIPSRGDFFDMSRCRDLIFHINEYRYTIPKIANNLKELGLEFHGFELPEFTAGKYWSKYPKGSGIKGLNSWWGFEQKNPNTFGDQLYNMWLRKPINCN